MDVDGGEKQRGEPSRRVTEVEKDHHGSMRDIDRKKDKDIVRKRETDRGNSKHTNNDSDHYHGCDPD
jgi:hypothetical protein